MLVKLLTFYYTSGPLQVTLLQTLVTSPRFKIIVNISCFITQKQEELVS